MENLDTVLFLMAVLAGFYSVAEKLGISYPILLVLAGLGISFIPGLRALHLTPEVVFLIFLPPLLFDAARHMSLHDLKKNRGIVSRLAIGLVLFSTIGVAAVARYFIPGFDWTLGFVLGAIVSPPDAVAATSATKGLRLPKRLVAILEGESLINDATALVIYRHAVTAAISGGFVLWQATGHFALVAVGGAAVGYIAGMVFCWLQKRFVTNPTVETTMTLLLPLVTYLLAEKTHVSGVLAVVTTGLFVSRRAHEIFSFRTRMQMNGFWDTLIFLLNGFVFILIGLQLPEIKYDEGDYSLGHMIGYGLMISVVVIVVRLIWIFPTAHIANAYQTRMSRPRRAITNWRYLLIIGWAGMRGVVSLATAFALPVSLENGDAFPQRDMILFITFIVILVTLVFQGLTLPLLIRSLKVSEPIEKMQTEERRLRLLLANSAHDYITRTLARRIDERALQNVRKRLERQISYLNGVLKTEEGDAERDGERYGPFNDYLQAEQEIIDHQRRQLIGMHKRGAFSDEVLRHIEADLDSRSMTLDVRRLTL